MMIDAVKVASYICKRYKEEKQKDIDEMKLHKLLYFVQRESIIVTGKPMFDDSFSAWRYGPVLVRIRDLFRRNMLSEKLDVESDIAYKKVFDTVFTNYAGKDSWSLSRLSHGETSWQKARIGLAEDENGDRLMDIADIREDANRIMVRRFLLNKLSKMKAEAHENK